MAGGADNLKPHEPCGIQYRGGNCSVLETESPSNKRESVVLLFPFNRNTSHRTNQTPTLYVGSSCQPQGKFVKVAWGMCSPFLENNRSVQREGELPNTTRCAHLTPLPKSRAGDRVILFYNLPVDGANWIAGYTLFFYSHRNQINY